jgi:hypothetical protein
MIETRGKNIEYLLDVKSGKIKQGLAIGCELDHYLRYKPANLNLILGHDNVGKTYWVNWYFLTLAIQHKIKFCIWSGENHSGQILRDLITIYSGRKISDLNDLEIMTYAQRLEHYFEFVDNAQMYTPDDLFSIFEQSDADACLIDPYTGLDRKMDYAGNYEFLNKARHFCNRTKKSLYINTHPTSESGRAGNLYPDNHEWGGHLKPPLKDHIEGGKSFLNRCDNMFVIHRLVKHETMKMYTMVNVEKIKDKDTGGQLTQLNIPVLCEYNYGFGFVISGVDPLNGLRAKPINQQTTI